MLFLDIAMQEKRILVKIEIDVIEEKEFAALMEENKVFMCL